MRRQLEARSGLDEFSLQMGGFLNPLKPKPRLAATPGEIRLAGLRLSPPLIPCMGSTDA